MSLTGHPQSCALAKPEFERYGVALVKARVMRKDGDWNCYRCGNINFQVTAARNLSYFTKVLSYSTMIILIPMTL